MKRNMVRTDSHNAPPEATNIKDEDNDWEDPEGRISTLCNVSTKDIVREHDGNKPTMNDGHEEEQQAWDANTGVNLDPSKRRRARIIDIDYATNKMFYLKKSSG